MRNCLLSWFILLCLPAILVTTVLYGYGNWITGSLIIAQFISIGLTR